MKLVPFTFLVIFAVLYLGLTVAETFMYSSWEKATAKQKELQQRVVFYQRLSNFTEQVLQAIAISSQHDPAMVDLLKKRQIKVVTTPPSGSAPTSAPATNSVVAPVLPDAPNTVPAPPATTPANP